MFLFVALRDVSPGVDRVANKKQHCGKHVDEEMLTLSSDSNLSVSLHNVHIVDLGKKFVNLMESVLFHAPLVSELLLDLF